MLLEFFRFAKKRLGLEVWGYGRIRMRKYIDIFICNVIYSLYELYNNFLYVYFFFFLINHFVIYIMYCNIDLIIIIYRRNASFSFLCYHNRN